MEKADNLKTQIAYFHINGAINNTFLNRHSHELAPGHNLHKTPNAEFWNPNTIETSCRTFPFTASLPIPLSLPKPLNQDLLNYFDDPSLKIVLEKERWLKRKQKMRKIWKEDKALSRSCSKINKTDVRCPRFVADFAQLLSSDPDPNFNSTYNWYYTDGSLKIINNNEDKLLLHCLGVDNMYLCVTPVMKSDYGFLYHDKLTQSSIKLPNNKPIYQIITSQLNKFTLIGTRQEKKLTIYHLMQSDLSYKIINLKSISTKDNLSSVCFEDKWQHSFCLADTSMNVTTYDFKTYKELRSINLNNNDLLDKWSSAKYFDPYTLLTVNRRNIYTIDIRSENISVYRPELISDKCDEISLFQFSNLHKNLLYVGTNHSLFSFDMRMLREIKPLQRWTHGMQSTPHLIDVGIIDNYDVIGIASSLANEVRVIANMHKRKDTEEQESSEKNEIIVQSLSLPWQPPTLRDSISLSEIHGHILTPNKYLKKRINFCNTGMAFDFDGESITMLTQNSFGDIYQQEIRSVLRPFTQDHVPEYFSYWIESINNDNNSLFVTNIINMKPVLCILKNDPSDDSAHLPKRKLVEKWQRPLNELSEYKDVLAADLLSAWNLTGSPEENLPSQLQKSSTSTQEKVSAWLERAPIGDNLTNEVLNPSQNINTTYNFISQPIMTSQSIEPMLTFTQPTTKPKKTSQKPRHFGGF